MERLLNKNSNSYFKRFLSRASFEMTNNLSVRSKRNGVKDFYFKAIITKSKITVILSIAQRSRSIFSLKTLNPFKQISQSFVHRNDRYKTTCHAEWRETKWSIFHFNITNFFLNRFLSPPSIEMTSLRFASQQIQELKLHTSSLNSRLHQTYFTFCIA